jgi:hypothetical protein
MCDGLVEAALNKVSVVVNVDMGSEWVIVGRPCHSLACTWFQPCSKRLLKGAIWCCPEATCMTPDIPGRFMRVLLSKVMETGGGTKKG